MSLLLTNRRPSTYELYLHQQVNEKVRKAVIVTKHHSIREIWTMAIHQAVSHFVVLSWFLVIKLW